MKFLEPLKPLIDQLPQSECQVILFGIIQLDPACLRQDLARMFLERTVNPNETVPSRSIDYDAFGAGDFDLNKSQRAYLAACRSFEEYKKLQAIEPAHSRGTGKFFQRLAAEIGCSSGLVAQAFRVVGKLERNPKLKETLEPGIMALEESVSLGTVETALQFEK